MAGTYQYDICAFYILLVLLFSMYFRHMTFGIVNRLYIRMIIVAIIVCICDILSGAPLTALGELSENSVFRSFFCMLYFAFRIPLIPLIFIMIGRLTGTWEKFYSKLQNKVLFLSPMIFAILLLLINPFFHEIYRYERDVYIRGEYLKLLYVVGAYYTIITLIFLFAVKKHLSSEKFLSFLVIVPINLTTVIIQGLFEGILIENIAVALSFLLASITIIRPEELVDAATGVKKQLAYTRDAMAYFRTNKRNQNVILVKIVNFNQIRALLGENAFRKFVPEIARLVTPVEKYKRNNIGTYNLLGGTFAVVYRGKNSAEIAVKEGERILSDLQKELSAGKLSFQLEVCVCLLEIPTDINNYDDFMTFSGSFEKSVPHGKLVHLSDISPEKHFQVVNGIDDIIKRGIDGNNFEMYYQPIYSVKEEKFVSAEALIRLHDERLGMVSPGIFIPAAEENGTIHQIGDFVIRDVCKFLASEEIKDKLDYIEINLSILQIMEKNIVGKVKKITKEYGIDQKKLNIEITETSSDYEHDVIAGTLKEFQDEGFEFSLDDYGTGYSNLKRVMDFTFKIIKMDKSFADGLADERLRKLTEGTIKMIKDSGAEIVVEGVETKEQADFFIENGCDFIQGYYYAKPMPAADFVSFINKKNGNKNH